MANVSFRLTIYQIGKAKRNKVVPDMKPLIFVKISLRNNRNRKFDKGRAKKLRPGSDAELFMSRT